MFQSSDKGSSITLIGNFTEVELFPQTVELVIAKKDLKNNKNEVKLTLSREAAGPWKFQTSQLLLYYFELD